MFFVVAGVLFAVFPFQIFGFIRRTYDSFGMSKRRVMKGLPDTPNGMRAFGIVLATGALGMVVFFVWQCCSTLP